MSVETTEPLRLPAEVVALLADIDQRVAQACAAHRACHEREFAAVVVELFKSFRDKTEDTARRETWASAIRLVESLVDES